MTTTDRRTIVPVSLDLVDANPWQPRVAIDPEHLKAIADSIESIGLLQHPMVRPAGDRYQLAFGHVRTAAMRSLNWASAEMEVKDLSDEDMALIALAENEKRKDVTPIEQYRAWQKMLDEIPGLTIERLADKAGFARPTVSNNLRLLKLPAYVLQHVDAGELSAHGAREFLCLRGDDGHFHDDIARLVLGRLTTGTPDWRPDRVRRLINDWVLRQSVSEWRQLFEGAPGGSHRQAPLFDAETFASAHAAHVHTLPNDKWSAYSPEHGKLEQTASRPWTCNTKAWTKAQNAAKSDAPAKPAKKAEPKPRGSKLEQDFVTAIAKDPYFFTVSRETGQKPADILKTFPPFDAGIAELMGTRAKPVQLKPRNMFKAAVDANFERYGDGDYNSNHVIPPAWFPDIAECRERCTYGAVWARFNDYRPLRLWCLNPDHYDEKLAQGAAAMHAEAERMIEAIDEEDHALLLTLEQAAEGLASDAPIVQVLAQALIANSVISPHQPKSFDGEPAGLAFARWSENQKGMAWNLGEDLLPAPDGKDATLVLSLEGRKPVGHAAAKEFVLRRLVEAHRNNPAAFDLDALMASLQAARPDEISTKGKGIAAPGNELPASKRPAGRRTAPVEDPDAPKLRSRAEQMMART